MAKQMPCAGRIIAVFTPITSPAELTSGPPELPGFSAASARKIDYNASCDVNDVAIGQDETVRSNHKPRAVSRDVARLILTSLLDFDVHHRRRDSLDRVHDRARVFVQQDCLNALCCRLI